MEEWVKKISAVFTMFFHHILTQDELNEELTRSISLIKAEALDEAYADGIAVPNDHESLVEALGE